jgi:uncharacterized protein YyaL (SSP411 family)
MPDSQKMNRLSTEKSPYLQQHANNPVWWQPWSEDSFEMALAEDKLIFLSIGYSTCHWCHVMEHESFEDAEVAKVLNDNFVAIKIDREELPDIDSLYMRAVQFMTGQGGWPMSVFLTPDLKPVFGGTYFPREYFLRVLAKLADAWKIDRPKIEEYGTELMAALKSQPKGPGTSSTSQSINVAVVAKKFVSDAADSFDSVYGGFSQAPKFPGAILMRALLELNNRPGLIDSESKELINKMVSKTLKSMASSGIYDQLGGGFSRYSTDERWCVPHFEKMLYDNAGLVITYLEAFKATKDSFYAEVVKHTLGYLLKDMVSPEGAFYAAEDADSEGKEGTFYVWTESELKSILSDDELRKFTEVYETPEGGNFEHGLLVLHGKSEGVWSERIAGGLTEIEDKLRVHRSKRPRPFKDTKIITEWNGFAIEAFALAGQVLNEPRYIEIAIRAASFIKATLWNKAEQKLYRRYCEGEVRFDGVLDDYAFLISGLLALNTATQNAEWLLWAKELQAAQDKLFWNKASGAYNYSSNQKLPLSIEFHDGATPNCNGVAVLNLIKFKNRMLDSESEFRHSAEAKIASIHTAASDSIARYPTALSTVVMGVVVPYRAFV